MKLILISLALLIGSINATENEDGNPYDAFEEIDATNSIYQRYVTIECPATLPVLDERAVVGYNLDFYSQLAKSLTVEVSASYVAGVVSAINVHLDNETSTPISTVLVTDTGSLNFEFSAPVSPAPTRKVHRVFFTFDSNYQIDFVISKFQFFGASTAAGELDGDEDSFLQASFAKQQIAGVGDDGNARDAFDTIYASYSFYQSFVHISSCHIIDVEQQDAVLAYSLDFSSGLAKTFNMRAAFSCGIGTATEMFVRLDSETNPPIATVLFTDTGAPGNLVTFNVSVSAPPSREIHRVFFTFSSNCPQNPIVYLNYLWFSK